ncbi:conserved hypothetical protein [Haloterrigena turkmenica DSM 5511]|uniref:Uncharacterized protein n=1 Tax=Haloterrigena turkmenica (strain ATCC 51198 / DSM 5511 / JCM 9101 / NCIMB 13204 / VKM B-1734 / 4k) TaxID=543526 RepID=D2RZH1_HALTV|nr:twin-arginine translocation signal domain-containing protein [Haloterrigena turkmenica]ADB62010.1 conserved hypothetical protein [Haloterrigena turkmenica DSM 5511]
MSDKPESRHGTGNRPQNAADGASRRTFLKGSAVSAGMLATAGCFGEQSATGGNGETTEMVPGDGEPAPGGQVRQFTVHAIEADVVYNAFGLHQPKAALYVLEENLVEALAASGAPPTTPSRTCRTTHAIRNARRRTTAETISIRRRRRRRRRNSRRQTKRSRRRRSARRRRRTTRSARRRGRHFIARARRKRRPSGS